MFHRRNFLKTTAAAITAWMLPRSLFARNPDRIFFIHTDTGNSWPVADPVQWSLENAHQPILERAAEGLRKLTPRDDTRIIRLVVRRCGLNLLELQHRKVVVHHWGQRHADIRPFFKTHGLARPQIVVQLRDRKKETTTTQPGDDFLFGDRFGPYFPLNLYRRKFASRSTNEPDDWSAAPGTWSGFAWAGVENNSIPWAALKCAWRRAAPFICQNCDTPTLLTNFGQPWTSMLNRTLRFVHVCRTCRRSFMDDGVKDVGQWIVANLDVDVQPEFEMVWGRRVKRQLA
jgi:hypothetical protein